MLKKKKKKNPCRKQEVGRLEWEKVYDELKMLQLQNTRGQLLILWTAAGIDGMWCLKNVSFEDGSTFVQILYNSNNFF
jgi:hypothetical protein